MPKYTVEVHTPTEKSTTVNNYENIHTILLVVMHGKYKKCAQKITITERETK